MFELTLNGTSFTDLKVGGSAVELSLTGQIKLNDREVNAEEVTIPNFSAEKFNSHAIVGILSGAQISKVQLGASGAPILCSNEVFAELLHFVDSNMS